MFQRIISELTRLDVQPGPVHWLAAGGVVVVVVAVCLIVSLAGSDEQTVVVAEGLHSECTKCGHAFIKPTKELTLTQLNTNPDSLRFDCPDCGAKSAAVPAVKCPNCGEYYLPASRKDPPARGAKDVCPHCKTDRAKWFRDHYSKNR